MSFDMRRRQESTRKRGYLDSSPVNNSSFATDNDTIVTDEDTNSQDADNHVSSKAYAVHDSSLEDLDRLIMFITESKQIQGRYYVRYLPGMMNPSGELTPCNYRPRFSFSPPRSPASTTPVSTTPTITTSSFRNTRHNNTNVTNNIRARTNTLFTGSSTRRSGGNRFPDVVDLTNEEEVAPRSVTTSRSGRPSRYTAKKLLDELPLTDDDDDDYYGNNDDDKDYTYPRKRAPPSRSTNTNKRFKQTARKSMRDPAETAREKSPEPWSFYGKKEDPIIYDDDDDDDPKTSNSNTTKETGMSSDDGSAGSEKQKKSNNSSNANNTTSSSGSSNNASSSSSSKPNSSNPKWSLLDGITVTVNPDFG